MEKNNKRFEIDNMITLCHIVDDFEDFESRLMRALSPKYNCDLIFKVWDISRGKFVLGARKAKKFYVQNKSVIDIINKYSNVPKFLNLIYKYNGELTRDTRFFYEYLVNHKTDIPKILELLEKLKELGFYRFEFNEELDFAKEKYVVHSVLSQNFNLIYVANPQVTPNYSNYIKFTTMDSNYKMNLELTGIQRNKISENRREIVLNSLLFDISTLPDEIDVEHIHGKLVSLKNEQQDKVNIIRESVDLNISVLDLESQIIYTIRTINSLCGIKNKDQLVAVLTSMKENLEKLKTLSSEHDSAVYLEEPSLIPQVLEQEKNLYLRMREVSKTDCC